MSRLFTRRHMIGAAGAVGLAPLATAGKVQAAIPPSGPLITLRTPMRIYDSRLSTSLLGGAKHAAGSGVTVTVAGMPEETRPLISVFANVTITQTESSGYLVIFGTDSSGERPFPETSNINWFATGQTFGNLVLTTVGSESGVDVFTGGIGRTHVIVDIQAYIPFIG
jgi:hypothetical protein